jgi:hypothetical protein
MHFPLGEEFMLNDDEKTALLVEVHRLIESSSNEMVSQISHSPNLTYPPGGDQFPKLSVEEHEVLRTLLQSSTAKEALRKVIANAVAHAFFAWFCVLDGVGDPASWPQSKT